MSVDDQHTALAQIQADVAAIPLTVTLDGPAHQPVAIEHDQAGVRITLTIHQARALAQDLDTIADEAEDG